MNKVHLHDAPFCEPFNLYKKETEIKQEKHTIKLHKGKK